MRVLSTRDAELAAKEAAKFNPADEKLVCDWIAEVTGQSKGSQDFMDWLKDGTVLVKLINDLSGGKAGLKANVSTMPFKQMENIANFLAACRKNIGMRENDLFTSADLYDGKSRVNVINGLIACSRAANKTGYSGPSIAPKESSGKSAGEGFKHQIGNADAGLSRLSMGSAGVMQKPEMGGLRDPTFGNKAAGSGTGSGATKLSMGSAGTMERTEVSKANDINFGNKASGTGDTSSASKMSMGSAGTMDRSAVDKSKDINFGANAGKS